MVAGLTIVLVLLGAAGDPLESAELPAYVAPQGWKAVIWGPPSRKKLDVIEQVIAGKPDVFEDKLLVHRLLIREKEGAWLGCDVDLRGHKLKIWKSSRAVIVLANGDTVRSEAIVASRDGPELYVHDNRKRCFVVGKETVFGVPYEKADGSIRQWPRLYLKFPGSLKEVMPRYDKERIDAFWFEGVDLQGR